MGLKELIDDARAYYAAGHTACRRRWGNDDCVCGMKAAALQAGLPLVFAAGSGRRPAYADLAAHYGMREDAVRAFRFGFDNVPLNGGMQSDEQEAWDAGLAFAAELGLTERATP